MKISDLAGNTWEYTYTFYVDGQPPEAEGFTVKTPYVAGTDPQVVLGGNVTDDYGVFRS